eukprot:286737_1
MWLFVFYIINLVAINQANLCETVDFDNKMKWMDSKFKGKGTKIMIYAYPRSKGVLWSKAGTNVWGDKAAKQVAAFTPVGTGGRNKHAEVLLLKNKHIVQSRQSRDDKKKSLVFIASKTPCKTCSDTNQKKKKKNYLVELCEGFDHCFYFYRKLYKDQNKVYPTNLYKNQFKKKKKKVYSTPVNWKNKLPLPRWTIVQCSSGNIPDILQRRIRKVRPNKLTLQQLADKKAVIDKELEQYRKKK